MPKGHWTKTGNLVVEFHSDFHNTSATVRIPKDRVWHNEYTPKEMGMCMVRLTDTQMKRVHSTLCGMEGCECGWGGKPESIYDERETIFTVDLQEE